MALIRKDKFIFSLGKTVLLLFFFIFIKQALVYAQDRGAGLPGAYLRIGVGARAVSMGSAFTGLADDVTSCYWNPAGLGQVNLTQFILSYQKLSMDRTYSYSAAAIPSSLKGTFAVSWIRFGTGEIETRDISGRITGGFSNSESAYMVSWGAEFLPWFYAGVTAKYLVHNMGEYQSTGYGFDAGLLIKVIKNVSVGLIAQNISTNVKWDTKSRLLESFPLILRGGVAVKPFTFPLTVTFDVEQGPKLERTFHTGCEWEIAGGFGIRAGGDNKGLRAGGYFTVPTRTFNLETSYSFGRDPLYSASMHRVSFTVTFAPFDYFFYKPKSQKGYRLTNLDVPDCRIMKIVDNYPELGLINLGSDDGIKKGTRFQLFRHETDNNSKEQIFKKIGTVEVIRVEKNLAAVKLIDRLHGYKIQMGDMLFRISD